MDLNIITGLVALIGVCYASLTLTGAPIMAKRTGVTVPAGSVSDAFASHRTLSGVDVATGRPAFGNPQPSDHCTVWRPPQ